MNVVTAKAMAETEALAYADGCREEDFMEAAGRGVAAAVHEFVDHHKMPHRVYLLCGKGNNAGDAYVAGCYLKDHNYQVIALQTAPIDTCSELCKKNHDRFVEIGGTVIKIKDSGDIEFTREGVIVDALFGTGLQSAPREPFASIINHANDSGLPIIAVDIPSGLNGNSGIAEGAVIRAAETVFLGLPKLGFFLNQGWDHVGILHYVDFGLPNKFSDNAESAVLMFTQEMMEARIPKMQRSRHKYQAGSVVGLAGSPQMPGAANMASLSALRGGAGIVKLLHPPGMETVLASSAFELIKIPYDRNDPDSLLTIMNSASALFIGPGIGVSDDTISLLKALLPKIAVPVVIDADGLNIIATHKITLPEQTILTPHHGEMRRLLQTEERYPLDLNYLSVCQKYAEKNNVTIILKGAPTFILHPKSKPYVIARGDPGMATAGSGDVLTGLTAALLAQGLAPHDAAATAAYIHAAAGEYAAAVYTSYCMIATDIIRFFPDLLRKRF
ncbi:MAG: NAD(P)H-hydrate dehydratase [Chlamydiales bacterium]|nr:NAD(P)H-hydrate dehydratase [Chlamydiia bacterium]MCP5508021.1 NAD(P)H-hydrate dehydratase [Chlamydiales bacterium]